MRFQWRGTLQIFIFLQLGWFQPLPLASTNWLLFLAPPQSTTLVGATSRPHLLWHDVPVSLLSVRVLSFLQRSPNASAWWDWVIGTILKQHPFSVGSLGATIGKS